MTKKIIIFVLLLSIMVLLFLFLYLVGIGNYYEFKFIKSLNWLDFSNLGKDYPIIYFLYFITITIFFIIAITIMINMIVALKNENLSLTTMNIDDLSIKKENVESMSTSFEKLVESLNKNINAIKNYTELIDTDLNKVDKTKIEQSFQEAIDSIYQDFSQMFNDISQSSTISELFEKIIYWGVSFSKSKRGSLMVVDKNKELYIYKTIGWSEAEKKKIDEIRIPLGTGIAGKVASENKRIFVTNIENNPEYDYKYKENYQTKSFISMPIVGINKVVAVLNITENRNGLYTMNDMEILNIITKLSSKIFELIQIKKKLLK